MIWNRKEVFVGCSLQRFNEVCSTLSISGIKYKYNVVDSTTSSYFGSSNRARAGTFGINMEYTKTYYLYVHKNDYDNAQALLRN
ncbi:hypothetical protein GC105_05530 [Alkalibaculum sp. M08DMB]|uniref:DUF2007 domain-containing protein n=2 Tax=Alkalibaculum sporogenes TaxID=2655001 RepID=A0A6A7K700_9FIRM|nr:hypothetical protein [Alkalibaculum sporogenes]